MGATLSLCWVRPGWLYFAHVGDSRIYHLPKDGGINQVSHDHTHVGWLYRDGQLNEKAARSHAGRNALQQVLGGKNQNLSPQFGAIGYEPGDRFLICSDGLVEGLLTAGWSASFVIRAASKRHAMPRCWSPKRCKPTVRTTPPRWCLRWFRGKVAGRPGC